MVLSNSSILSSCLPQFLSSTSSQFRVSLPWSRTLVRILSRSSAKALVLVAMICHVLNRRFLAVSVGSGLGPSISPPDDDLRRLAPGIETPGLRAGVTVGWIDGVVRVVVVVMVVVGDDVPSEGY